ncbi:MAG: metal-sensitive transcriptional regulator [Chloroflexi bacterium]|nr:metal-sensitive transcriptional regulator [Chloroflexota bacterium]
MDTSKKSELLLRLKSIAGHIKGVEKMVADDAYCIDVISQVQAIQAALNKVNLQILDDHLHSCVITAIRGDDANERERLLGEISSVFEKSTKL